VDLNNTEIRALTPKQSGIGMVHPIANGNYVTWWTYQKKESPYVEIYSIYLYDLSADASQQIPTPQGATVGSPWIEYPRLVWFQDQRIKLRDLEREETIPITDWGQWQTTPKLSGRWLAYLDFYRFPKPEEFEGLLGGDVILFDLCTLGWYKDEDFCD